ncbi:MAG: TlpA family protein disulfide reductase [Chlorobi bacterium]|nr:TlpA family protein disulfide reductase [Chlorobiota bacterium]
MFSMATLGLLKAQDQKSDSVEINKNRGYIVNIGDKPGNIQFNLTDGNTLHLHDLRDKIVVLQFTASWCSVCRKEMPHLEKEVWQRFKNEGFILIGIDFDEPLEKVLAFKKQMKTTYPMALDPDALIFQEFAHKRAGVTRNVVIDKNGKIAYLTRLYDRNEFEGMVGKIEELMGE